MTVKAQLQQLRIVSDELQQLYTTRAGVYDMLTNSTARPSLSGVRGPSDPHRLDILGELTDRVDGKIAELAALRVWAIDAIYRLEDPQERTVLMAYYVNCRKDDGSPVSWPDVAAALHLSARQLYRVHADAVAHLEKMALNVTAGL